MSTTLPILEAEFDIKNDEHFKYLVECTSTILKPGFDTKQCSNFKDFHNKVGHLILSSEPEIVEYMNKVRTEAKTRNA